MMEEEENAQLGNSDSVNPTEQAQIAAVESPRADSEEKKEESTLQPITEVEKDATTAAVVSNADANVEQQMYGSLNPPANIYQPPHPLGFRWLERTYRVGSVFGVPFYLHSSIVVYICCELIWAIAHGKQGGYYLAYIIVVMIFHFMAVWIHFLVTIYTIAAMGGTIHRAILWPYGVMGFGCDYSDWYHQLVAMAVGPLSNLAIALLWLSLTYSLDSVHWTIQSPMKSHFLLNIFDAGYMTNIVMFSCHFAVPLYAMKSARLLASILSYKRDISKVVSIMVYPTGFMSLIIFFYGIVDHQRVIFLFLGCWGAYQTFLFFQADRKGLVHKLPIFQMLQRRLRAESAHRRRHSRRISRQRQSSRSFKQRLSQIKTGGEETAGMVANDKTHGEKETKLIDQNEVELATTAYEQTIKDSGGEVRGSVVVKDVSLSHMLHMSASDDAIAKLEMDDRVP